MLPAQQGFKTEYGAIFASLGLIIQLKLAALDRVVEILQESVTLT